MNSLDFLKEMEILKETCQKVYTHLKSHQMTLQTLKWDADNLQSQIYEAGHTLKNLQAQQEQAKATAEAIIAEAKRKAEMVDAEIAAKRKELQEYEQIIQKREERFEKSKYLKSAPAIA